MDILTGVLLLISLVGIFQYYYSNYKKYKEEQKSIKWPPNIKPCPDYWVELTDGSCQNTFSIGDCPKKSDGSQQKKGIINFKTGVYKGPNGDKFKCRWAKKCHNSWEGLDNLCA